MSEELGTAALSGALGGGWAARAACARALTLRLLGSARLPPVEPQRGPPPGARPLGPRRAELAPAARAFLVALFEADPLSAERRMDATPWVLDPEGGLAPRARAAIAAALAGRPPLRVTVRDIRSYTFPEAAAALPRGVAASFRFLGLGPWVTVGLESPDVEARRVLLVAAPLTEGPVRFRTLPLGAPDEDRPLGLPPRLHESPAVRIADAFTRAFLQRRGAAVRSMRGRLAPRMWVDGRALEVEALADALDDGPPAFEAHELRLTSVERAREETAEIALGPELWGQLEADAPHLWYRSLADLRPAWVVVGLARRPGPAAEERDLERLVCGVIETLDPDGTGERLPRARLAVVAAVGKR